MPLSPAFEGALARSAAFWVLALLAVHLVLPPGPLLLRVSALFSLSMNVPYPSAAVRTGRGVRAETTVAALLSFLALYALATASATVLAASVALHGVWDACKHGLSCGVAFFPWYLSSCLVFDLLWAAYIVWS